ncbi:DUF5305 domain-containing protein [Haloarcula litorea]|uniref:DUF5305 domain-containing protein n=1 Tax=Haloarcula litorea TaxID=3032579 RepID=UPI0023E8EDCC|nr:DUF5305 domain-containing protein [Halomicroarcula sp. GDY20]
MNERRHRIRTLLADNATELIAVLLVVTAAGGFLAYTAHVAPGTTTEQRQVSAWESTGSFTHQATVQNGTEVYERGSVLRNRSAYFRAIAPRLSGTFDYGYAASDGGNLSVETRVALVFQSVQPAESEEGTPTVYWRTSRRLASASAAGVGPGERVRVPFSLNVTAADQRLQRIDEQFGGTPGEKRLLVAVRVDLSGTRNGRPIDRTRTYRLPVSVDGNLYRVADPGRVTASDTRTERVTVPAEPGRLRAVGGPALLLVGLLGLGAVGYHRRTAPPVTEAERRWLDYRRTRAEFDDWITAGRVPPEAEGPPVVDVDSLAGLVDVAIDTDERVVEDERRGACLVLREHQWYRYEPPPEPRVGRDDAGGASALADRAGDDTGDEAVPADAGEDDGTVPAAEDGLFADGEPADGGDGASADGSDDETEP